MKNSSLYETHVNTVNLEKAIAFYESLELELAYVIKERRVAFFWFGKTSKKEQMLGVWEVKEEEFQRKHFAFRIPFDNLQHVPKFLRSKEILVRGGFGLDTTEPIVHAWMPAASYYFQDPDGNSLEYIALLDGKSRPELGTLHLSEWEKRVNDIR